MTTGIALIVGLGNPGANYAETRHNAGFRFLDAVCARAGASMKAESKFFGTTAQIVIEGHELRLLAPSTFMNRSGQAVAAMASFYKFAPAQILVIHDELDLAPGVVRLKSGGGHGGHNGLRDIIDRLGSRDFMRLRLGIGHPGSSAKVESYVLKRASVEDEAALDGAIDAALDRLGDIAAGRYEEVMNVLHARKP